MAGNDPGVGVHQDRSSLKPNSTIEAAICAICSGECVRALLAYGTSRSSRPDFDTPRHRWRYGHRYEDARRCWCTPPEWLKLDVRRWLAAKRVALSTEVDKSQPFSRSGKHARAFFPRCSQRPWLRQIAALCAPLAHVAPGGGRLARCTSRPGAQRARRGPTGDRGFFGVAQVKLRLFFNAPPPRAWKYLSKH